jgi:NitT/TauT family transport system substrate-binding protein
MARSIGWLMGWLMVGLLAAVLAAPPAVAGETVRVAAQYGLGYAPLLVLAKKPDFLHKYAPDADVRLTQLAGGAAVREALLSDSVDIGGLAITPIVQAWAKGADLKIALGLADNPIQLITWRPDLKTVQDLKPNDKVNVISIGSPQTLVMKMAAQKYFGSPNALDSHFLAIPHPDGVTAVLDHGSPVAEFATPPYIRVLMAHPEMHVMLSNKDFPEANFMLIVAAVDKRFAVGHAKLYAATMSALTDVIAWMNEHPQDAASFLSANEPGKLSAAEWLAEMQQPGVDFSATPHGVAEIASFMHTIGMVDRTGTFDDLTWPNLHGGKGN